MRLNTLRAHGMVFLFAGAVGVHAVSGAAEPVVHWTFDLSNGVLHDARGNAHGTLEGQSWPDRVQPGIFGNALHFDTGKSRVRIPHSEAVSLENDFTIEYVIKPFRIDHFRTIFWKGDRTVTPQAINYYVDLRDGRPELKTKDAAGRWIVYSTPTALTENDWHHVVITYASGTVDIYINGKQHPVRISEDGERGEALLANPHDAFLGDGASPAGSAYSFSGLIDEVRIYRGHELSMLGDEYEARWRILREETRKREEAFRRELARRAVEQRQAIEREYDALFRNMSPAPNAGFGATVLDSTKRLNGTPDFFRQIPRFTHQAMLSAARREYEGFQVILLGRREAQPAIVSATVSDLIHADGQARIPSSALSVGRVERVATEEPDIPVPFVGPIPDVIFEDDEPVTVPPGDFANLYCRVYTGDAPPGLYEGTLTLAASEQRETIHIALRVYDFALPVRPSLRTAFCFFEQFYQEWYGWEQLSDAQRERIYEFLLDYRLSPCNIYSSTAPFPELRFLEKYRDRINFFTIGKIRGDTIETARADAVERVALLEHLREAGLEEYMYFYGFDELSHHLKRLPAAVRIADAWREVWPELKMMQTSPPIPELQPLYNVWAPLFGEFSRPDRSERVETMRQRGDRIWWYAADAPRHPLPNLFLDYPVFDCRVIGTLSYVHKVEGVLYWCINREWQTNMDIREQWPDAPWTAHIFHIHTGRRKFKNGMGNLVYPGKDGKLLSSLRLENLRDGLEDYEYLHALNQAVRELEAAGTTPVAKALLPEARALLTPPAEAVVDVQSWSHDPTYLLEYRDKVGRMIETIAQAMRH